MNTYKKENPREIAGDLRDGIAYLYLPMRIYFLLAFAFGVRGSVFFISIGGLIFFILFGHNFTALSLFLISVSAILAVFIFYFLARAFVRRRIAAEIARIPSGHTLWTTRLYLQAFSGLSAAWTGLGIPDSYSLVAWRTLNWNESAPKMIALDSDIELLEILETEVQDDSANLMDRARKILRRSVVFSYSKLDKFHCKSIIVNGRNFEREHSILLFLGHSRQAGKAGKNTIIMSITLYSFDLQHSEVISLRPLDQELRAMIAEWSK